jgi:hypothetical protein
VEHDGGPYEIDGRVAESPKMTILRAIIGFLRIPIALALAATVTAPASSATDDCSTFRSWFVRQPGSQLVLSSAQYFDHKFASPTRRDKILDYSVVPGSSDSSSWYKAMQHYRTNVGNGRCFSAVYNSSHKTALVLSEYGTGSDLTMTTVSNALSGLPNGAVPRQTQNGVRFGMTVAQVQAIDGPGTLRSDGSYQRLTYTQNIKKSATVFTGYLGFLFSNGKLVAADVGGGI